MHGGTEWALPYNVLLSNSEVAVTMWVFKHSWFSTFTKDKGVRSSLKMKAWTLVHYFKEHWTWCARQTPGAGPSTCRSTDYAPPLCCEHINSHLYLHKIRHSQWSCPSPAVLLWYLVLVLPAKSLSEFTFIVCVQGEREKVLCKRCLSYLGDVMITKGQRLYTTILEKTVLQFVAPTTLSYYTTLPLLHTS